MIYCEDVIDIKPTGKTGIKSSMQIKSLFLHNNGTYAYSFLDDKVTKISHDGSIKQVESSNLYGKTQNVVYVNKCGDRIVKIGDGRSSQWGHEVMILRLPPTDFGINTKRFSKNCWVKNHGSTVVKRLTKYKLSNSSMFCLHRTSREL